MRQGYCRIEDQKSWPNLALKQDFALGRRPKSIVKKCKYLTWEQCLCMCSLIFVILNYLFT